MMSNYKKKLGNKGEKLVLAYYISRGCRLIAKNYIVKGCGEIDLILDSQDCIVFVEAKVVNYIDSIQDYITSRKLYFLQKTIEAYIQKHNITKHLRLDVVFVKQDKILEVYENITNN